LPSLERTFKSASLKDVALRSGIQGRVMSVWKFGSLLLGSSGGRPPLGDARVIWAPASLKTQ
jgi:hypothetical protein